MKAYERLLNYVKVPTPSDAKSVTHPSSECQKVLAELLAEEMKQMGVTEVRVDDKCYVYGKIPATRGYENKTKLGFIAHMDTVSDFADHAVNPVIHEQYDGEDLPLSESGRVLKKSTFPHLPSLNGRTLITSDGTTVLGADDKAGVAEIMTLAEALLAGEFPHGQISIAFTPDEEIGEGADFFDVEGFGADYAYTADGGPEGEIEFENFNASAATFQITGFNVHPGSSKDTMINAAAVACEIQGMLPEAESPRNTEGYEGFYHLTSLRGDVAEATAEYIIRDHDAQRFAEREENLHHIADTLNQKYGEGTVKLAIREQYRNMEEKIRPCYHLIENAQEAVRRAGMTPKVVPIRGGTDGARLSYMGLPCPNLGTGGYAFHGPYEHITVEGMDRAVEILKEIVKLYAE
ncbi:MAG: peptidase T [Fusicatenibacter sp.]|nr:peptidase T [Fusicatenibacter sp.]